MYNRELYIIWYVLKYNIKRIRINPVGIVLGLGRTAAAGAGTIVKSIVTSPPHIVRSLANTSIYTVASMGYVSLTCDLAGKVLGARECSACNGWEAMLCRSCQGSGRAPFAFRASGLDAHEADTPLNLAKAVHDGRADVVEFPLESSMGPALPSKKCSTCQGSGVMKCQTCGGASWRLKLDLERVADAPWKSWDVLRISKPYKVGLEAVADAQLDVAAADTWLVKVPELTRGTPYSQDFKDRLLLPYQIKTGLANKDPEFEGLKKALDEAAKEEAANIKVTGVRTVDDVAKLPVPPRPKEWGGEAFPTLVAAPDWSTIKDPSERAAWNDILRKQDEIRSVFLEQSWEDTWRQQKAQEAPSLDVPLGAGLPRVARRAAKKSDSEQAKRGQKEAQAKRAAEARAAKEALSKKEAEVAAVKAKAKKRAAAEERVRRLKAAAEEREAALQRVRGGAAGGKA